jgi:hypothetical protein
MWSNGREAQANYRRGDQQLVEKVSGEGETRQKMAKKRSVHAST